MKTLNFSEPLPKEILEDRKNVTFRMFDDKDLQVGDELILRNKDTGEDFAKAKIVEVREKPFGEINDQDLEGHEKYESREAMLEQYREYYGEKVNPHTQNATGVSPWVNDNLSREARINQSYIRKGVGVNWSTPVKIIRFEIL